MSTNAPNARASLLSGLRTGGVRAVSGPVPHTAAPGASFSIPRMPSGNQSVFPEEDDDLSQNVFAPHQPRMPMTAAVDGPGFVHQQRAMAAKGMNPASAPFNPAFMAQASPVANPAFQMQMMQLELMKMQAFQAQQYQAQLIAQAQLQSPRRQNFNPPATAGPLNSSFDLRSATLNAQMRRATQPDDQVPMTAALDGRFGGRPTGGSRFDYDTASVPSNLNTSVISGGTSLGSPASNNVNGSPAALSKSDSASTWRRGGNNNSVLSGNNRSPSVKVTPPPADAPVAAAVASPTPAGKARPQPLRFSVAAVPVVAIDAADIENEDDDSSSSPKSGSNSIPDTPHSSSNGVPLSPREEASKKLYEGLGMGRPAVAAAEQPRMTSQPVRQPRGPPSSTDELGPKNFATRIRRQAIGGLGALMNSRERRDAVEAY